MYACRSKCHCACLFGFGSSVQSSQTSYCPPDYDYSKSKSAERYNRMRDAIDAQPRPILYSLCQWGEADVQSWGNGTAQSWRSTGDIMSKLAVLHLSCQALNWPYRGVAECG